MPALIARIVIAIISIAVSYYTAKKSGAGVQPPASFDDFEFPQFDEGTPVAYIFGDVWLEDWMVLGAGNYRPIQKKVSV